MSGISLLAIVVYATVICACLAAVRVALQQADRRGDALHWASSALIFAGLAAARLLNAEDRLRDAARGWTHLAGNYETRAALQIPLASLITLAGLVMFGMFVRQWRRNRPRSRARLVLLARFALIGLVPLFGMRLVSLHQIDQLLYSGPLRINWLLDGAISAVVGISAAIYAWTRRRRLR